MNDKCFNYQSLSKGAKFKMGLLILRPIEEHYYMIKKIIIRLRNQVVILSLLRFKICQQHRLRTSLDIV